jgi:hypothetical protein
VLRGGGADKPKQNRTDPLEIVSELLYTVLGLTERPVIYSGKTGSPARKEQVLSKFKEMKTWRKTDDVR